MKLFDKNLFIILLFLGIIVPLGKCQDFIRVYLHDQLVFEAPAGYTYTKELPAGTYRIALLRLVAQTAEIAMVPGDSYRNAEVKLAPPFISLGNKENEASTREVTIEGKVEVDKETPHSKVLVKAFKNLRPDTDTGVGLYGEFRLVMPGAPGTYTIACYREVREQEFTLESGKTLKLGSVTFLGKSTNIILMNFKDTNLYFVLQYLSEKAGISVIVDDSLMAGEGKGLKETVTIINAQPVSVEEAFDILKSILSLKNIGVIRRGKIWKITTLEKAVRDDHDVTSGRTLPDLLEASKRDDRVVTQVIPLQYAKALQLKTMVEPLISEKGKILHEETTNRLVITDYASNTNKILKILMALDVPVSQEVAKIYFLQYVGVKKLEPILKSLFDPTAGSSAPGPPGTSLVRIIPAPQVKAVIVLASEIIHGRIRQIIAKLDTQPLAEEITVAYPIQYNQADKLAELCLNLYGGSAKEPGAPAQAMFYPDVVTNTLVIRTTPQIYKDEILPLLEKLDLSRGDRMQSYVYQLSHSNAERLEKQLSTIYPKGGGEEKAQTQTPAKGSPIRIVADKTTNALVIACSPSDYESILKTIKELDIETKQVFIEVLIAEITLDDNFKFGVEWMYRNKSQFGTDGNTGTYDTDFGLSKAKDGADGLPGFRYALAKDNDISALLNMLVTTSSVEILSAPRIYTSNNEEAKIIVGEEVPIIKTRQERKDNDNDVITRDFEYREVGLITTVTPFINNQDEITIKVAQEISAIDRFADPPANTAPIISKRKATTQVKVKNEETVILGGLFQDKESITTSKVPFFGDLPLVGPVFTSYSKKNAKTELLIFITPRVVHVPPDAPVMMRLKRGHKSGVARASEQEVSVTLSPEKIKWLQTPRKWERKRRD
jgi:general secretion pathway protein D